MTKHFKDILLGISPILCLVAPSTSRAADDAGFAREEKMADRPAARSAGTAMLLAPAPPGQYAPADAPQAQPGSLGTSATAIPARPVVAAPPFRPLAYEEDYSHIRDAGKPLGLWEKLKNIPLFDGAYLSLGGEFRPRVEIREHSNFGRGNENSGPDVQQRTRAWADLHLSPWVRVFGELESGTTSGLDYTALPIDNSPIELHQMFIEFSRPLGNPTKTDKIALRLGRQEIIIGKGRLFDIRNPPTNRQGFDAARLIGQSGAWRFGALAGGVVRMKLGDLNDGTNNDWTFYGGHVARKLGGSLAGSEIEAVLVHTDRRNAPAAVLSGKRDTLSLRMGGRERRLDYDVELIGQWGTSLNKEVRAWFIATDSSWQLPGAWKPRLGARIEIGSGSTPNASRNGTYDFLWSRGPTFTPELGFSNLTAAGPTFSLKPTPKLTAETATQGLWRTTRGDGLYNLVNAQIRSASEGSARYVGIRSTAKVEYQWNRFVSFGIYADRIFAGDFLKQTGNGKSLFYSTVYSTIRL